MLASHDTLRPMISKLIKHIPLDSVDRFALENLPFRLSRADSKKYIVRTGERPRDLCVVLNGFAFSSRTTSDGNRLILAIYMRGDLIDLATSVMPVADSNTQALTEVNLGYIPYDAILDIGARHPAIGRAFWRDTLADASIAREWMVNLGRRTARQRVSHFICEMGVRQREAGLADGHNLLWPFTQEQVADVVGLTAVHVNRTLQGLRTDNLVSIGKHVMSITNQEGLMRAGDFHPDYLLPVVHR